MALASASEGLANAWVEALACGTPIVITAAGGAAEVVTDPVRRIVARNHRPLRPRSVRYSMSRPREPMSAAAPSGFTWEANSAALFEHLAGLVAHFSFL